MALLAGWKHYVDITIPDTNIDADLTHFPILVKISTSCGTGSKDASFIFDELGANSLKIAFTEAGLTDEKYAEIEKWDHVAEAAWIWVSKSDLVLDADGNPAYVLRMYFDNDHADNTTYIGGIDSTPGHAVWDSYYKMVQHMPDTTTSTITDSTSSGFDGTKESANHPQVTTSGKIGDAQHFDEVQDYIGVGQDRFESDSVGTISAWIKRDLEADDEDVVFSSSISASKDLLNLRVTEIAGPVYRLAFQHYNGVGNTHNDVVYGDTAIATDWYHVTVVSNGTAWALYVNGAVEGLTTLVGSNTGDWFAELAAGTHDVRIGVYVYLVGSLYFDGIIDEVRYSSIDRSAAWIKAGYNFGIDNVLSWGNPVHLKALFATASATGTIIRFTSKTVVTGTVSVLGTVSRAIIRSKILTAATATVIGTIRPLSIQKVISGASDVTGVIVRFTTKTVATGAVTASGTVIRKTAKTVAAAAATAVGTMLKKAKKVPVGAATVIGTIRPLTVGKVPDGQVTIVGVIQRFTSKIVATGQVTVGGLAIQKVFKTVATATATVVGTVSRKTGKILTGAAAVTGLLRPFNIGKIVTGLTTATGTIIQFLYDINYVMNQTIRRIYAKVRISYSDPFFSGGITTSANQVGRESYTDQTADEVTTQYAKWFSLHRNVLDGSYHPMPSGKEHSVGWWGTTLSDAVTREFATDPVLTIEFTARTIEELLVVGDDRLAEYPEDFTIKLYSAGDVLEHTEDVNGNNLVSWTTSLSPVETDIVKMTLTIEKWSRAEAVSKIAQFYTALHETYYSEDGDLVSVRVLEEREYEAATIPQGDVSSSEITIRLNNIDDKFSPGNWESELYGMLKNNRAITAWLGVDMIPSGVRRWYPLGTFFSRDWFAPEDEPWAEVKGLDMLDRLRITEFSTSTVYTDVTLHDLAVTVMTDAGLTSADWEIDAALDGAAYTIPYAWFDRMSHREALRRIAAGALGQCYCNRDGKIVLEIYSAPAVDPWTDFHFTRANFFTVDHPLAWTQMVNYVQARAAPRVASAEQDICLDTETFTVPGSSSVTKTHYFDQAPCIDVVDPVVFTNPGGHVTLGARNVYAWGMTQVYTNSDPGDETVTDVTIRGKLLEIQGGRIAVAQDAASIAANGKQALGEPISSEFWQSETMAQASADALLAVFKDPRRDVMMRARGNIGLALGDRVIAPDYKDLVTGHFGIMRQDIDFNGGMEVVITAQKLPDSVAVYHKTLTGKVDAIGTVPLRITDYKEIEGDVGVLGSVARAITKTISGAVTAGGTIQAIPSIWRKTYSAVASIVGTVGRVWDIDLGAAAIDRAQAGGNNWTFILLDNPALNAGTITTVKLWAFAVDGGTGVKVGTFYGSGTNYTSRNYATLPAVSIGYNEFAGLSIEIVAGDYIGIYLPANFQIDLLSSGGAGIYSKAGDQFGTGLQTYALAEDSIVSLWGEGQGSN